jgi:ubiquitin-protein ligase
VGKSLRVWIITITGAKGTIFEDEKFKLRCATSLGVQPFLYC